MSGFGDYFEMGFICVFNGEILGFDYVLVLRFELIEFFVCSDCMVCMWYESLLVMVCYGFFVSS